MGHRVGEVDVQGDQTLVGGQQFHQFLPEFLRKHGGGELDGETAKEGIGHVAQEGDVFDFQGIRSRLALGFFLGPQAEFLPDFALDEQGFVQLDLPQELLMVFSEEGQFIAAVVIFQQGARERPSGAGGEVFGIGHQTSHAHFLRGFLALALGHQVVQRADGTGGEGLQFEGIFVQRM